MQAKGASAFEEYYSKTFGSEWPTLHKSLFREFFPCFLIRPDKLDEIQESWKVSGYSWKPVEDFNQAIEWPDSIPLGTTLPGVKEGYVYPISPSSLLPIKALDIRPGHTVLDACAAPGGKTCAIGIQLQGSGQIIANDLSPERLVRLRNVINKFGFQDITTFKQQPAEILARRIDMTFDRILIDAPCSSEAHVIKSTKHLDQWSHKRIEVLHKRQVNMVTALLPLLNPDGKLVYSTCALTPEEDEAVVEEVKELISGFKNTFQQKVRPDVDGFEPMFVAVFERQ